MKRSGILFRGYLFFILVTCTIPNAMRAVDAPTTESRWYHGLQKRMDTFKRNMTCAFTEHGCSTEQKSQLLKSATAIIVVLGMLGVGVKVSSMYGWEKQSYAAQETFDQARERNSLQTMLVAIEHSGLVIGEKELGVIKKMYEDNCRSANRWKKDTVAKFKSRLQEYFVDEKHDPQLKAKESFWKWVSMSSPCKKRK